MNEDPRRSGSGSGPVGPEPGLFDLPLDAPGGADATAPRPEPAAFEPEREVEVETAPAPRKRAARSGARPETLPLFDFEPARDGAERTARERPRFPPLRSAAAAPEPPSEAPLAPRLRGAGGDLVIVAAIGALAAVGAGWLGAPIGRDGLVPLALFLLAWSFVYFVVPLAFWGQTPGMSWAGLVARSGAAEPLSFGQASMRWLGTWITWATLGLGGLLAFTGRSLADRISGSTTYLRPAGAA